MALPTEARAAETARREELKRQICELIDDAAAVTVDAIPVLRVCGSHVGNRDSCREPTPGKVRLSIELETGSKHPQFKQTGRDEYTVIGFE